MTKVEEDRGFAEISRLSSSLQARPSEADYANLERLRDLLSTFRVAEVRSWPAEDRNKNIVAFFDYALAADVSGIKTNEGRVRDSLGLLGDMIRTLLNALEPSEIITLAGPFLVGFLTHPFPPFRTLALEQIRKAAGTPELRSNPLVTQSCAICVGDEDLSVAEKANDVILSIAGAPDALEWLFSDRELIVGRLNELMKRNDLIKFRVQELAVRLSSMSEQALRFCIDAGFLGALLEEFRGNDILGQLNALQLLTDLAETSHGLAYIENQGIVQLLEASLKDYNGPMASFIIPGLMKFFGHITLMDPEGILHRYPGFVETTYACLNSEDLILVGIALDTIGHIGGTPAGKLALHKNGLDRHVGRIFHLAETSSSEIRIKALDCLGLLISVKGMGVDDGEITEVTNSWFRLMQQEPMTKLVTICHRPFPDIRNAAFKLLEALASQKWGLNYVNRSPGLVEYLLDRNAVKDKEGKEAKYAIVQAIAEHPESANIFHHMKIAMFRRYVNEGPFYVAVQAEVAMEGDQ